VATVIASVSPPNVCDFAKNKLEPIITKQQRQAMNPDEVRYFKEERARLFKECDQDSKNDFTMEVLLRARLLMKGSYRDHFESSPNCYGSS